MGGREGKDGRGKMVAVDGERREVGKSGGDGNPKTGKRRNLYVL